jgi:hypothetical protein
MKYHLSTLGLLLTFITGFSQNPDKTYLSTRYALERMGTLGVNSNSVIPGLPPASAEVLGDPFSKRNFAGTTALLYNEQTISNVYAKYDMLHDDFYIQTKQGLRVLPGHQVKSFSFIDSVTKKQSTFINAKEFKATSGTPYVGFFEVLYDGQMALLKKSEATIQKANYHVALNVGRQDHQVNKKFEYYYLVNDVAEKLPATKNITTVFGDKKAAVEKFIKINQLNLKDERHLTLTFDHYNQALAK